jgi:hypothetical protein
VAQVHRASEDVHPLYERADNNIFLTVLDVPEDQNRANSEPLVFSFLVQAGMAGKTLGQALQARRFAPKRKTIKMPANRESAACWKA